jgi:type I restriction enzyme M protein
VVVVPHGVLFRHGADEMIRRQMLEEFHLDAVVSLTAGWLQGTSVKASILCVSRREPAKEVVFVGERLWDEGLESHAEPRNVKVRDVEADEVWSFIGKKEKRVRPDDDQNLGDCYTFVAG